MSTPSLVVFVRELVVKAKYLDTNKHKELRSEVGNQAVQAKVGIHEL